MHMMEQLFLPTCFSYIYEFSLGEVGHYGDYIVHFMYMFVGSDVDYRLRGRAGKCKGLLMRAGLWFSFFMGAEFYCINFYIVWRKA